MSPPAVLVRHEITDHLHLRVYDIRDTSHLTVPSPFLYYSLTHTHRFIGYRNRNPQSLTESSVRLMYVRVYDSRDRSSPSPYHSLTHTHNTLPTTSTLLVNRDHMYSGPLVSYESDQVYNLLLLSLYRHPSSCAENLLQNTTDSVVYFVRLSVLMMNHPRVGLNFLTTRKV